MSGSDIDVRILSCNSYAQFARWLGGFKFPPAIVTPIHSVTGRVRFQTLTSSVIRDGMKIQAKRYDNHQQVELTIVGTQIESIRPLPQQQPNAALPWVAPGFVDLQVNGYGGHDFSSEEIRPENVTSVAAAMEQFGCLAFCPTVTTQSQSRMVKSLKTIAQACAKDPATALRVAGIHVEGPFICGEDGPRGAHPLAHVRPPNWDEFQTWQEAADGRIRIVTLSPEYEESPEFIRRATNANVVIAIGHTAADSDQIAAAVDAGAQLATHLGNGAHGTLHRHPNYIWDQMANDQLMASLIVDGHHLPPAVVKSIVRAKTPSRCVLVSDMTALAGMPPGDYRGTSLGDVELLPDGRLVVAGQRQYLAGASLPIGVGVANVVRFAGVELAVAVEMASQHPAELISLPPTKIEVGNPANLVLFDWCEDNESPGNLVIRQTIRAGETAYTKIHDTPHFD